MKRLVVMGNCYGELDGYTDCKRCKWRKICDFYREGSP